MRWLRSHHGARPTLGIITKALLQKFYRDTADGGRHGNSRNLDTRRRLLLDVFIWWEWAHDQDEYSAFVHPPRRFEVTREAGKPTIAPTWEEMAACVRAAQGWHGQVATLLYYTGLRVQQVMLLHWTDFDFAAERLTIRGELGKSHHERTGRIVPISKHLAEELASWPRTSQWLFDSPRARGGARERVFRARDMGRAWARAGVREEVWKRRPDHSFRKGFVSGLKRLGADSEAVEYLVGHRLPGVRDVYVDASAHGLRAAIARIPPVGGFDSTTASTEECHTAPEAADDNVIDLSQRRRESR
jgi:integrase